MKILYVVDDTTSAQFRYRVENVIEATEKNSRWEVDFIQKTEIHKVDFDLLDLVVILRQTAKDKVILDFIKDAHRHGKKVLFDLDDLVFNYSDLPELMQATNSKNVFYWTGYVWGIRRIAERTDGYLTTNDFLGKLLEESFDRKYAVIPNSLNKAQVDVAEKCLANKKHDGFTMGYFSGSPTHTKDLRLIEDDLIKFLNAHEDAKFVIVGYMEISPAMQEMVEKSKVEILGLVDYLELMELEAKVDVNLAPLVVSKFTNSKSELKFFEAAAVETVTIASPSYTFKKAISDGENGLLVQPGGWYNKLEYLYNNPNEREKMAKKARKYALENYYGKRFLKRVEEAYEFFG